MSKKLFVAKLPFTFTDDQLRALFAPFGTVRTATMVPDPKNNRTRGFGFVAMSSDEETQLAIEKLNCSQVEGREIWVSEARPKPESNQPKERSEGRPQGRPQGGRSFGGRRPGGFSNRDGGRDSGRRRFGRGPEPMPEGANEENFGNWSPEPVDPTEQGSRVPFGRGPRRGQSLDRFSGPQEGSGSAPRGRRPFPGSRDGAPRRDFNGPRKEFGSGQGGGPRRDFNGPRKEFGSGASRPDFRGPRKEFGSGPRSDFKGPRKEFGSSQGGERRPFGNREGGPRRDFNGPRKTFGAGAPRPDFKGPRKEFGSSQGGERRPFSENRPTGPRPDSSGPRKEGRSFSGPRKPFGGNRRGPGGGSGRPNRGPRA